MKAAGLNVVRMGHLAWDSYEPSEGKFDFPWFDKVMDLMNDAGIKVILDIAIRPAPIWLHHKYPSIDIVDANGDLHYPNHRYMDDVGDPMYQKYAVRYADSLTKHYGKHPALMAFGIDNESGDGPISYSETARKRFITWLKKKYTTLDNLNKAWATQRLPPDIRTRRSQSVCHRDRSTRDRSAFHPLQVQPNDCATVLRHSQ